MALLVTAPTAILLSPILVPSVCVENQTFAPICGGTVVLGVPDTTTVLVPEVQEDTVWPVKPTPPIAIPLVIVPVTPDNTNELVPGVQDTTVPYA